MTVSVLVPFRSDGGPRDRNWAFLRDQWNITFPGWEVIEGSCPDGPWVKSLAIQDALSRASGDVLVLCDADVWTDGVEDAVDALAEHHWAVPHTRVLRFSEGATEAILAGELVNEGDLEEPAYTGVLGGGMTVLRRELYEQAPLDPRFRGWGQEDWAAALAWRTLGGQSWRGTDDLWHLWHPAMPRQSRAIGSDESKTLYRRYTGAVYNRKRMLAIMREFQ